MEEYLKQRGELILKDRALRPDHATLITASSDEYKADDILSRMRKLEAQTIWSKERKVKSIHGSQQMFPGMEFLTSRETIVSTKLFEILSQMPKGGLLHAHLDATVRADILLRLALQQPIMHVRSSAQLVLPDDLKTALPEFSALPVGERTHHASICGANYLPSTWVPLQNARKNFSEALGGPEGFDRWVISNLMIDPSEAYGTHNTPIKIWDKFSSTFLVANGMIRFMPVFKEYVRHFLLSSIEDGIMYVEPRILFYFEFMRGEDGEMNVPHRAWLEIFDNLVNELKSSLQKLGRGDDFIGAKIIYSTMRDITTEELEASLEDCIRLKQEFPHLIAGFDLVGHEDVCTPLIDFIEPLQGFVKRQKELGLDIPFIFHAGETSTDGAMADMNLYDAILLGTKRIGHGFSIFKHPHLMDLCRERGICLEMCPISNEILRLTGSMPMHPLPAILNHGVHVALCSDDPSVFGNMGLTFDFFQVFVASEINGLSTLREFVWDSIRFSSLDEQEKKCAFGMLERRWTTFVRYILDTHGAAYALKN